MSEQEHCSQFLHPYINLIFFKRYNDYEMQLNRSVQGTKQRPDLSCT
ncbi:5655_t:CDS:1, partial [Funneliformis caledonium]